MIPLIRCEISFGSDVSKLVFGVDVLDLDFLVQVNSIEKPIKRNSVVPGNMSHCGAPSFNDHLDHCFVVLKHIQKRFLARRLDVWGNTINIIQHVGLPLRFLTFVYDNGSFPGLSVVWVVFPRAETIISHNSRTGIPSNLNPASKEMISDSVELCETEVCFLHIQLIGTNVWLPKMHNVPPEVEFESSKSPAKSESWNSPSQHCFGSNTHIAILFVFTCVMNVCNQSIQAFVTGFWSILWSVVQVYSLTVEYQVFQLVPNFNIFEQFESILVTILQQISFLLFFFKKKKWWSSMQGVDTL